MKRIFFLVPVLLFLSFYGCKKDPVVTDSVAGISFSTDTVLFDTVFTTVGSVTKRFRVYNSNDKRIIISNIRLGGGSSSLFRLNVDGIPGKSVKNVEIPANDSIFVFVEVTVDPNNQNNPLIVSDSILFETNGNLRQVQLVAWGQDAYFHVAEGGGMQVFLLDTTTLDIVWDKTKPHVIYGHGYVDTSQTLTIQAGTNIYFHNRSGLIIEGILKVKGTMTSPVTFQGDKLGYLYKDVPSQWSGIWLYYGTRDNEIDYAVIKNGNVGLRLDTVLNSNPTLKISNTIIKNMGGAAILSLGAKIDAYNCVFSNCGIHLVWLEIGGEHSFRHCTFANFWSGSIRQTPSLKLNNYYYSDKKLYSRPLKKADFENCIIYGNLENEIEFDKEPGADFNYRFHHCILRIDPAVNTSAPANYKNVISNPSLNNDSTIFKKYTDDNYELSGNSIAIDKGDPAVVDANPALLKNDIKGVSRNIPDLGAYEKK